ncbi:MAG: BlaI/MecI/CopY family transcriptional regulator [Clostridiaceae bacterium]|nr:BlaI/MecI/CopY family transcriptional regulator [Clostridiaceae bacterium]
MKMHDGAGRISDSELLVMQQLWTAGMPLSAAELQQRLADRWDGSTVKTLLRRLCAKGAAGTEKREVQYFRPLISQKEYAKFAARELINRVYGGSARNLVASLVDAGDFSETELKELRSLLHGEK